MTLIALAIAAFLGAGAAFHFYWGFGGRVGLNVAVPHRMDGAGGVAPLFVPARGATLAVAIALTAIMAVLLIYAAGATFLFPRSVWRVAIAVLGGLFLARGVSWHPYFGLFKRVHGTAFARNDSWLYSPGCVLAGLGFLTLAWGG